VSWTYPRRSWTSQSNTAPTIRVPTGHLILHHSVTSRLVGVAAPRQLDRIARNRGFTHGYSYSAGVTTADTHEGRGAGRAGAHTVGYNRTGHAIVLIGNFDSSALPDHMVTRTAELAAWGHRRGWWPDRITLAHRQVASTACPGRHAVAKIPTINAAIARILSGRQDPGQPGQPDEELVEEELMPVLKRGDNSIEVAALKNLLLDASLWGSRVRALDGKGPYWGSEDSGREAGVSRDNPLFGEQTEKFLLYWQRQLRFPASGESTVRFEARLADFVTRARAQFHSRFYEHERVG